MHQDLVLIIIMLIRILFSVIRAIRPYLVLKKNLGRACKQSVCSLLLTLLEFRHFELRQLYLNSEIVSMTFLNKSRSS